MIGHEPALLRRLFADRLAWDLGPDPDELRSRGWDLAVLRGVGPESPDATQLLFDAVRAAAAGEEVRWHSGSRGDLGPLEDWATSEFAASQVGLGMVATTPSVPFVVWMGAVEYWVVAGPASVVDAALGDRDVAEAVAELGDYAGELDAADARLIRDALVRYGLR